MKVTTFVIHVQLVLFAMTEESLLKHAKKVHLLQEVWITVSLVLEAWLALSPMNNIWKFVLLAHTPNLNLLSALNVHLTTSAYTEMLIDTLLKSVLKDGSLPLAPQFA